MKTGPKYSLINFPIPFFKKNISRVDLIALMLYFVSVDEARKSHKNNHQKEE